MEIPHYPAMRPLALADKFMLEDIFARLQPQISEFTFANLYLFRSAHDYHLTLVGDAIVVMGKGYGGEDYFLPPLTGSIGEVLSLLLSDGLVLYGADEPFVEHYFRAVSMEITEDRDNFDYLYLRAEMAELAGNRFHKKKNRVNYFTSRYDHVVELYGRDHLAGSLALLEEWSRVRGEMESSSVSLEMAANREALELADSLGLAGVVILVEGVVRAFALGERLNGTTSVCHFEKSDPFLEGVSQLVDREFNRLLFTDCRSVNREQDLGKPGLRSAKLSYHPVELVKKFRLRARP